MPGHPCGKPAGERCANLTVDLACALWGLAERPACCAGLQPTDEMCGDDRRQAIVWLLALEQATRP